MTKLMTPLELAEKLQELKNKGEKHLFTPMGYPGTIQRAGTARFLQEDGKFGIISDWDCQIINNRFRLGYPSTSEICPNSEASKVNMDTAKKLEELYQKSKLVTQSV